MQTSPKDIMEKRVTTLEVRMDQTAQSIDRLDRSITDLRVDMDKKFIHAEEKIDRKFARIEDIIDRKFSWSIGIQITTLLAMMAFMGKMTPVSYTHLTLPTILRV